MNYPTGDKKLAFDNSMSNFFEKISRIIIGFLITVFIVKYLTVENYGNFKLFVGFVAIAVGLTFSVDKIFQRYFAEYIHKNEKGKSIKILLILYILRIAFFIIFIGACYFLTRLNIININKFDFNYFVLAIITSLFAISAHFFLKGLSFAYLDNVFFNSLYIIVDLLKLIFIYLFHNSLSVKKLIIIWLSAEVITSLLLLFRLNIKIKPNISDIFKSFKSNLEYKRYWDFGKFFLFAVVGTRILSYNIDNYFLSYYHNNEIVGLYAFSTLIPLFVCSLVPSNLLYNVLTPLLTKKYIISENILKFRNDISVFLKLNVFIWAILSLFVSLNLNFIITKFFKTEYLEVIPIINVWLLISLAHILKNVFEPIARVIEKTTVYISTFVAAILNLIGNLILIPKFGIYGALISTGSCLIIHSVCIIYLINRIIRLQFNKKFFLRLIVNLILFVSISYPLTKLIEDSFVIFIGINIVCGFVAIVIFKTNKCFTAGDRKYINNFLPKNLFIF